jgi:hypothetical protein
MVIVQLLFLFPPCERPDKKIMWYCVKVSDNLSYKILRFHAK